MEISGKYGGYSSILVNQWSIGLIVLVTGVNGTTDGRYRDEQMK
jgi:hypothetical protein